MNENVLVVNFSVGERTNNLSNYCFNKAGFNNVTMIEGQDGFVDKFIKFAQIAIESNYDIFIRSDADRLVFEDINILVDKFISEKVDCAEGFGFEFFMNTFRGATPHVFSRKILKLLLDNNSLMPKVQKPESTFVRNVSSKGLASHKTFNILTNLHEYEQYPSKVCNSLINRIARGHKSYYDINYLKTLDVYKESISHAFNLNVSQKTSMDHINFDFLDKDFSSINNENLDSYYNTYKNIFNNKKLNFK